MGRNGFIGRRYCFHALHYRNTIQQQKSSGPTHAATGLFRSRNMFSEETNHASCLCGSTQGLITEADAPNIDSGIVNGCVKK